MTGYLGRLVARSLGVADVVRPVIAPLFAGPDLAPDGGPRSGDEVAGLEVDEIHETERARDRPAPVAPVATTDPADVADSASAVRSIRAAASEIPPPVPARASRAGPQPAAVTEPAPAAAAETIAAPHQPPRAMQRPKAGPAADPPRPTPRSATVSPPAETAVPRPFSRKAPDPLEARRGPTGALAHPSSDPRSESPPGPALLTAAAPIPNVPRVVTRIDSLGAAPRAAGGRMGPALRVADEERTVEISIGRIEIRATPSAVPAATPMAPRRTAVSLDAYLQARSREGRA